MRTGTKFFLVIVAIFFIAPLLRAADAQWPARLGSWTGIGEPSKVATLIADPAFDPIVRESGFTSGSSRTYSAGNLTAKLTLFSFRDSSGAYEAYTSMKSMSVGDIHPRPATHLVVVGNQVLWLDADSPNQFLRLDGDSLRDLTAAAEKWQRSVSDRVASPPIANYLPDHGLEVGTDLYALGPAAFKAATDFFGRTPDGLAGVVGFNSNAEAMFGRYKNGKDAATLLLIDYPTPQLAELHMRHLRRALADAKLASSSIERKGSLLSIVLAPTSPEYAEKLRSSVNYETQVTWNEASQAATDPPILSTVAKIFIATGVFMVVTVVIGIAFGGVRIITKRLFPGKVFDRKEQMEVLQLGLNSKPIDPSDMY
jgi:hypothetical protein